MSFQEKSLTCQDCGKSFAFTAEEQQFHAQKGYTNLPKRCPDCRSARRAQSNRGGGGGFSHGPSRQMYPAVCASCGKETEVPFEPRQGRPVYCRDCFQKNRGMH